MPRINFNEEALRKLRAPTDKTRESYWDKGMRGFGLRITKNGVKSFVVQARTDASVHPVTVTLCQFTGRNFNAARKLADERLDELAKGKNPNAERKTARNQTLGEMAEKFIKAELNGLRQGHQCESFLRRDWLGQEPQKGKWRRERAANGKGWRLIRPTQGWQDSSDKLLRDRPIKGIGRQDIVDRLDEIKAERGKFAARHAFDAIRRLLNWCAEGGSIDVSPVAALRTKRATGLAGDEMRRERVITDDELWAIWHAADNDAFGNLVRLLLLTGQRRNDWADASWSEIAHTPDGDVLTIPGARYKNKRAHVVPLTLGVVKLLQKLPRFDGCDFVLSNDGSVALGSFTRPKRRLDKASGVSGWRLHDLRRTVRSHMPPLGVSRDVSERLLGHAQQVLDRHYDHHDYTPQVRAALEAWERRLAVIVAAKGKGKLESKGKLPGRQRALSAPAEIVS